MLFDSTAHGAVGRTPGNFSVSQTGAATYTIPIWNPPGPNGMEPHIALTYNSQQRNGTAGVGWNVSGLSSIYRCNRTYAQDGAPAAVTLTTADALCMDGKRLRLTSGTYGQAGSTYQTEIADFSQVTAVGTAGNGPASFTVQARNGWTYEYGNGGSSQVLATSTSTASSWMLDKVTDRAGNTMTFSYVNTTGTAVPDTISWTPSSHGASTYNYTMVFGYGSAPAPPQSSQYGYVAGTSVVNTNILQTITINNTGTLVKEYFLYYQASPTTSRSQLYQIQECADSAKTNCLSATTVSYQSGSVGVSSTPSTAVSNQQGVLGVYDFDGDGRDDLLYADSSNNLYVVFGTSTGFGAPIATGISNAQIQYTVAGDVHGTGRASILTVVSSQWWEYTWNPTSRSFTGVNTTLAVDPTTEQIAVLTDVDGDGLVDLVTGSLNAQGFNMYTRLNVTTSGGSVAFSSTRTTAYSDPSLACQATICQIALRSQHSNMSRSLDFDGDGRGDLVVFLYAINCTGQCGTLFTRESMLLSRGGSFSLAPITLIPSGTNFYTYLADVNDDGCTDVIVGNTVSISGCNGSSPAQITLGANVVAALDWDGDGRTDLLINNGGNLGLYLSTGGGFSGLIPTSVPWNSNANYFTASPTGDGLNSLAYWTLGSTISYYLHNGAGQPPDLMISVTDGYNIKFSPTYVSVAQDAGYTNTHDGAYPDRDYVGPMYVVHQFAVSDGASTAYTKGFGYTGAHMNLTGRGFDGFYAQEVTDSRNSMIYYYYYRRDFPFVGLPYYELEFPTAKASRRWDVSYASTTLDNSAGNQRYFVYPDNSSVSNYESGSPKDGQLIRTVATNYSFDNYGNPTTVTRTVTDNDSGSPYYNQTWTTTTSNTPAVDTANWCLTLLSQTQSTYTASNDSPSVTRTKTFTPDTSNCRYTQVVTEPNSTTLKMAEGIAYDVFGNVSTDTITGVNMTPRTTTIDWGTTGQFPMVRTDPSGAVSHLDYNFSFGVLSSLKDANNLTTSWQYGDGFGRRTQETRPDGTATTWSYALCPTGCPSPADLRLWVNEQVRDTGNQVLAERHVFFNDRDEVRFVLEQNLDGSFVYKVHQANDWLGRQIYRYVPDTAEGGNYHWITYDALSRPTLDQFYVNGAVAKQTSAAYAGDSVTTTDELGKATTRVTTAAGTLGRTQDHNGYYQSFSHDAYGSLTGVADSLGNTLFTATYAYGVGPLQTDATDMDLDVSTAAGQHRHYNYDALGELTSWSDAKGQSFSQTYDALSRPLTRTEPDLTTNWVWGSNPANHEVGHLSSTSAGSYSEQYTYDSLGRVAKRRITTGTNCDSVAYCDYDFSYSSTTGLLDHLQYPQSPTGYRFTPQYTYQYNLLSKINDFSTPSTVYWTANSINAWGEMSQETLGSGSSAIVTNRAFDPATGWMSSTQSGVGGGAGLQNESYLYDLVGNLTQRQNNNASLTENFYYDNLYRLDHSTLGSAINLQLTYDPTGNITSRSDVAGGAAWTYSATRRHAVTQAGSSSFAYSYDANGNMTSRQGSTITWSSYNYPMSVTAGSGSTAETITFAYGPSRQRWKQIYTGNGTTETTTYVGGKLEIATAAGVSDYRHYIYVGNRAVAIYSRKSTGATALNYLLADHQGSMARIVSSSGSSVVTESFTSFGARRNPTTWSGAASNSDLTTSAGITRQGYTSQTSLGLWMGLNHMNGRIQDAVTGRFLSADPAAPVGGTQGWNRYAYARNNPLTYVDPSGFDAEAAEHQDGGDGSMDTIEVNADRDSPGDSARDSGGNFGGGPAGGAVAAPHNTEGREGPPSNTPKDDLPLVNISTVQPRPYSPWFTGPFFLGAFGYTDAFGLYVYFNLFNAQQGNLPQQGSQSRLNKARDWLCQEHADDPVKTTADTASNVGSASDLGSPAVALGSAAAGASRSLAPYGQAAQFLGNALAGALEKVGAFGTYFARGGIVIDAVNGNLQDLAYDAIDYRVYAGLAALGATGEATAGTSTAAAISAGLLYYNHGGSKGYIQGALGCGSE